jgi:hypothetical protein
MARYISTMADYNLELKHLPGPKNHADPLSRRPDFDDGSSDNEQVVALPNEVFVKVIETTALDQQIIQCQHQNLETIEIWRRKGWKLHKRENTWWKGSVLVIVNHEPIAKGILKTYYDRAMGGHPGIDRTYWQVTWDYWWPGIRGYIHAYLKGCGICQQNKVITHRNDPPLNPIFPPSDPEPFKVISVDLIVKLPKSGENDTILTITDQGNTKGIILIPCSEEIGTEELARLYKEKVFPYIGLPSKLISDRDTRFISKFVKVQGP